METRCSILKIKIEIVVSHIYTYKNSYTQIHCVSLCLCVCDYTVEATVYFVVLWLGAGITNVKEEKKEK